MANGLDALCPACVSQSGTLAFDLTSATLSGDLFGPGDLAELFPEVTIDRLAGRRDELLIYEARLANHQQVWLKIAPCLDLDEAAIHQCLANLEKARGLDHEGIARILNCGERDGCLFVVSEEVSGTPLNELIASDKIEAPERALDLAGQLVSAIQTVRRFGIESSISIDDVVITENGRAVVTDIGMERMLRHSASDAANDGDRSTNATSLGALFYELLTGESVPTPAHRERHLSGASPVSLLEDHVEGYLLEEKIGEGGFGIVYLAEQQRPVRRKVALKILKPGMDSAEVIKRFEAERQALALLDDPNTATIYDAGETAKGRPFFAMELVDGEPITQFCQRHQLGLRRRLDLFIQVCHAIRHAHQRGLIHRDLKPSNILVHTTSDPESSDAEGTVKVIDFGIAKATEGALADESMHTKAAQVLGTPNYMSPEQARMDAGSVDTRSDVYSLGAILYELLTGSTPFHQPGSDKTPLDEIFRRIREDDPPRPADRVRKDGSATNFVSPRELQGDLTWIAMKALRKAPADRYSSVNEFIADLRRYLDDEPIVARPPSLSYNLTKFVRRHRTLTAAVIVGATTLLVGSIVSTALFIDARESATAALQSDTERRKSFSRADFLDSRGLLEADDPRGAVARLARAVRTDPDNHAAAFKLVHTLTSHTFFPPLLPPMQLKSGVGDVAFSPDGNRIAAVTKLGEIALWDAHTGERLQLVEFENQWFSKCEFDPSGERLAVTGHHAYTYLLDVDTGAILHTWENGTTSQGMECAFTPDGTRVAVTGDRGHTVVWDAASGEPLQTFRHAQDYASRIRFTSDGNIMVTTSHSSIEAWDFNEGTQLFRYDHEGKPLADWIAISPNNQVLASAGGHTVELRSLKTGKRLLPALKHPERVIRLAFSPCGSRLVTGTTSPENHARTWDVTTGRLLSTPMPMEGACRAIAFSPDSARVFVGSKVARGKRGLGIFHVETGRDVAAALPLPRGVWAMDIARDGQRLVTASRDGLVRIWDIRPRAAQPLEMRAAGGIYHTCFTPRGVGALSRHGHAEIWSVETGESLGRETNGALFSEVLSGSEGSNLMRGHRYRHTTANLIPSRDRLAPMFRDGEIVEFAASHDGAFLVTGCRDGFVRIYDPLSGTPLTDPVNLGSHVRYLTLNREGSHALAGNLEGTYFAIELEEGEVVAEAPSDHGTIHCINDNGRGIIGIGYRDGAFRLLDESAGSDSLLQGHTSGITNIEFFAGHHVVTTSVDNTAIVWDVRRKEMVSHFTDHIDRAGPWGLYVGQTDPDTLVTGGTFDATMRAWDWRTGTARSPAMQSTTAAYSMAFDLTRGYVARGGDHDFAAGIWDPTTGQPLTGDLPATQRVFSVSFSPDGKHFVAGSLDGTLRVYDLPPAGRLPEWFLDFAEAFVGMRYDTAGLPHILHADTLRAQKQRVLSMNPTDGITRWAQWLAAEASSHKSISPLSKRTPHQAAEWLQQTGKLESLERSLLVAPEHPSSLATLATFLARRRNASASDRLRAGYLSKRAYELDPHSIETSTARAQVLRQLGRETEALQFLVGHNGISPATLSAFLKDRGLKQLPYALDQPMLDRLTDRQLSSAKTAFDGSSKEALDWEILGLHYELWGGNQGREIALYCYHQAGVASKLTESLLDSILTSSEYQRVELIAQGSSWAYQDGTTPVPSDWFHPDRNHVDWPQGAAPLGYGNGSEQTRLHYGSNRREKPITAYFRKTFDLSSQAMQRVPLTLAIHCDDAALVFVNGMEACRINLPSGPITPNTHATTRVDGEDEALYHRVAINPALLRRGSNTISVEVHQFNQTSSDLSFDLSAVVGISTVKQFLESQRIHTLTRALGLATSE